MIKRNRNRESKIYKNEKQFVNNDNNYKNDVATPKNSKIEKLDNAEKKNATKRGPMPANNTKKDKGERLSKALIKLKNRQKEIDEEEKERNKSLKSDRVTGLAKQLEETLKKTDNYGKIPEGQEEAYNRFYNKV